MAGTTKAGLVATSVILAGATLIGGTWWWRSWRPIPDPPTTVQVMPGMPLDVKAYLQKRSSIVAKMMSKADAETVRSIIKAGALNTSVRKESALRVAELVLEADSAECAGRIADVNGDGRPDLVVKRYYSGSGAGFEILVCLDGSIGVCSYLFSGSERGITFFGNRRIPLEAHLLDQTRGGKALVIPECIVDRGAETVLNWPTVYSLRDGKFEVCDSEFKEFYDTRVLPQFSRVGVPADDPDVKVVREIVRGLGSR